MRRPDEPCGGPWLLALNDDASTDINAPPHACTSLQPYMKPPLYNAEKLLKFCNVGAIRGVASGYGCMVLVLR